MLQDFIARIDTITLKQDGSYEINFSLFRKSKLPRPFIPQMYTKASEGACLGDYKFTLFPEDWSLEGTESLMDGLLLYEEYEYIEDVPEEKREKWIQGYFVDLIAQEILESGVLEIYGAWEFPDDIGDEPSLN